MTKKLFASYGDSGGFARFTAVRIPKKRLAQLVTKARLEALRKEQRDAV